MTDIRNPIDGVIYCEAAQAEKYLRSGGWSNNTIGATLRDRANAHPKRLIFISGERGVTYDQFNDDTDRLAAALLDLGLVSGDRAIFQMGTVIETAIALVACYKAGIVPVCSLPQHREVEIGQLTDQSSAKGYFVQADFSSFDLVAFARQMMAHHASLRHLVVARGQNADDTTLEGLVARTQLDYARKRLKSVQLSPRDVLSFQLSGGTTGVPKIIPRFHGEYLAHSAGWMRQYAITSESRVIWSLPLLHNAGQLYALIPAIAEGVTTVLMPKVDIGQMLDLIEQHGVTHALSIGPIAPLLMNFPNLDRRKLSSLRLFATMSRADALEAHLGIRCSNLYGITEGLLLGTGADAPAPARHRTQGRSGCPEDQIRLLEPDSEKPVKPGDPGELCFRGPSSLRGYYNAPEENRKSFTSDGFYRTGDMMTAQLIDGETYFTFEGRSRDNINRGGEKIGCEEVESFVSMHKAIADAKLVAMPDEFYGEKGCVFIILRPGHVAPNVKELGEFLIGKGLAKFKCPERVVTIDAFPQTRVGKVDKPALRVLAANLANTERRLNKLGSSHQRNAEGNG